MGYNTLFALSFRTPYPMRDCLVTGATGFLAGHLIEALLRREVRVRALTRPQSDVTRLASLPVHLYVAGTKDEEALQESMRGTDTIFHTAAAVDFWTGEPAIWEANVRFAERVFRAAREVGVRRFVFTSTIGVYGAGFRDVPEDAPHTPLSWSPYERSKAEAERSLRALAAEAGPELVIVRPGHIMGDRDDVGLIPHVHQALVARQFAYVDGGRALNCPSYAGDVAEAHVLAAMTPAAAGRAYHATDGSYTTIRELVSEVARQAGLPQPTLSVPFSLAMVGAHLSEACGRLARRRTMPRLTRAAVHILGRDSHVKIDRAVAELGYRPKVDYREAIRRYLDWARASSSS